MAVDARTGALTHVGVATVWGLVVMVMIDAVGSCNGVNDELAGEASLSRAISFTMVELL